MKNSKLAIIIVSLLIVYCLFFIVSESLAVVTFQPQVEVPGFKGEEVTGLTLAKYIKAFYDWAIKAIVVLAVVMIVVAGFQWMAAIGSAPLIGQAKKRIGSALMGLLLALGTYFILHFVNPDLVELKGLGIEQIKMEKELYMLLPSSLYLEMSAMAVETDQQSGWGGIGRTSTDVFKGSEKGGIWVIVTKKDGFSGEDKKMAEKKYKELNKGSITAIAVRPPGNIPKYEMGQPFNEMFGLRSSNMRTQPNFINPGLSGTTFYGSGSYTVNLYFSSQGVDLSNMDTIPPAATVSFRVE